MTEIVLADRNRGVHPDDRPVVLPFYLLCDVSASMEPVMATLTSALFRIRDALAPYDRFVRGERERTEAFLTSLRTQLDEVAALRARVERLAAAEPSG